MAAPANRLDNLRTLRVANLDGAFANAFATMVGGAFVVAFIQSCGGSDAWIGFVTALGSFVGLVQIPGAIWGRAHQTFKRFVAPGGLIWRIMYLPLIALPLLPIANELKLWTLACCILIASIAVQIVTPIYNDWLAELIPSNSRGWYFSRRNALAAGIGAAVALLGGAVFDQFKRSGAAPTGLSVVFGLGAVFAAVSMFFFLKMRDLERTNPIQVSLGTGIRAMSSPFRDRSFRKVLVFYIVFILAQAFPGNLFGAYALKTLNLDMTLLQLTAIAHALGNIGSIRFWGYLADKYGNKPVLAILTVGIALTPAPWLFCRPDAPLWNTTILFFGHIFAGMCWGGISVSQFNLLLATAKDEDRANYIGAGLAIQSVVGGIAPLLSGQLMGVLTGTMTPERAYHVVFIATMVMRTLSLAFLWPVKEEGALSIRGTLRQLVTASPSGYRALGRMATSGTEDERQSAIADAASAHFQIARDEIIDALHDPSPRVRREAARALARLGDESAVEALTHMIQEHPDLLDDEIFEALGELGHEAAVREIASQLDSPRPSVRRAAAKALGDIGGVEAAKALRAIAGRVDDPDARRAALQGLRTSGATEAWPEIAAATLDPLPSVRIAACEAVAELDLKQAAMNLRQSLRNYSDEACSEAAYALGCVGEESDIALILGEAKRSRSVITRRRCLLGAARLFGVEAPVYRVLRLQEMSRDSRLLEELRPAFRACDGLEEALNLFSSDREQEALVRIAKNSGGRYSAFAELQVRESFLVAAYAAAQGADSPDSGQRFRLST